MTIQDVINRTRVFLKDDIEPYRLPDTDFFNWINDALYNLEVRRPDLLVGTDGTLTAVVTITAVTDNLVFPDRTAEALATRTAYQSYLSEDADRHNLSQAAAMLNQYETLIQTI